MSDDLHPHWTNIGSSDSDSLQKVDAIIQRIPSEKAKRVRINRRGHASALVMSLCITVASVSVVGLVFYMGVNVLQADLINDTTPDVQIDVTAEGFKDTDVAPNDLVEIRNVTGALDTIRSLQNDAAGKPLIGFSVAPADTARFRIVPELAGGQVTLVSTVDPLRRGVLHIVLPSQPAENSNAVDTSSTKDIVTTTNDAGTSSGEVKDAVPAPVSQPVPSLPVVPVSPVTTVPVLNIGATHSAAPISIWPTYLRINQFAIGSAYVPAFSPTQQIPIHTAREAQKQVHAASSRPPAITQPETGPGLWVVFGLTMFGATLLLRSKKKGIV